jgi:hypothetical protein
MTFKKSETQPHVLSKPHFVWKVEAKNRAFASICKIINSYLTYLHIKFVKNDDNVYIIFIFILLI